MRETVVIPKSLDLRKLTRLVDTIANLRVVDEYVFDFSVAAHIPPFAMLFLASALKRLRCERSTARFVATHFQHLKYQAHMGFFELFGLHFGRHPGEADGSTTYLPITELTTESIRSEAASRCIPEGEVLEQRAEQIAELLTRQQGGRLVDTLRYTIREMLRNIVEHSQSDSAVYCAQYWPSQSRIEVAVIDSGIGLRATLSRNPQLHVESDADAICLALMPGVTGTTVRKRMNAGPWDNSGYGLYMTSRICSQGGDFFISSGTAGLKLSSASRRDLRTMFNGTALRLVIDPVRIAELSASLSRFADEGFRIAKETRGAFRNSASLASRMLSRDFRNAG